MDMINKNIENKFVKDNITVNDNVVFVHEHVIGDLTPTTVIINHKTLVKIYMDKISNEIYRKARIHDDDILIKDNKKTMNNEVSTYNLYSDLFEDIIINNNIEDIKNKSKPFKALHYKRNDHHPESFKNSIKDMDLVQITEWVIDEFCNRYKWDRLESKVSDDKKSMIKYLSLENDEYFETDLIEYLSKKYNLSEDLKSIIKNTINKLKNYKI